MGLITSIAWMQPLRSRQGVGIHRVTGLRFRRVQRGVASRGAWHREGRGPIGSRGPALSVPTWNLQVRGSPRQAASRIQFKPLGAAEVGWGGTELNQSLRHLQPPQPIYPAQRQKEGVNKDSPFPACVAQGKRAVTFPAQVSSPL